MKKVHHRAAARGHADHGWLDTCYTFSFANYYNPERIHFGMLRVLNDNVVAAGRGFGVQTHDNMEIVLIPLEGDLGHEDSMDNISVTRKGEIQVMSAGTGITHSEFNKNQHRPVKFLQIWIFPKVNDVAPRYEQAKIDRSNLKNRFEAIVAPMGKEGEVHIHQDAWFHLGELEKGKTVEYKLKDPAHGVYNFVIKGEIDVEGEKLETRDGMGVWETDSITVKAVSDAEVLLIEVPMNG